MARIVTVAVIDLTRPVEQKGFKSCLLLDCTEAVPTMVVSSAKELGEYPEAARVAESFFANGGHTLVVGGADMSGTSDGAEVMDVLAKIQDTNDFYGITALMPKEKQDIILAKLKEYAEGNEKLVVTEILGEVVEVESAVADLNSDRVAVFATKAKESTTGLGAGVCGVGFPQAEGSITWGNKVITGVPLSKYTASEEVKLQDDHINYLTKELGFIITQFGRTLSGSNIDITRSKDFLRNRIAEALTSALVNSKKIAFTTKGLIRIDAALTEVGAQAVSQDMLVDYEIVIPDVDDIPTADKANRVLRNVKFIGTLSGSVETIEMELQVKL